MKKIIYFFIYLFMNSFLFADGLHFAGGIYLNYRDIGSNSEFALLNDLRAGYRWDFNEQSLAVMVTVENEQLPQEIDDEERRSIGTTIAYYYKRAYFMGTYFIDSKLEGANRGTEIEGDGIRLDAGLNFTVTDFLKVGPRLTWRRFNYDNDPLGNGEFTSFEPTFAFHVFF